MSSSKDKSFWIVYKNLEKIKKVEGIDPYYFYIVSRVEYVIIHEEIDAILFKNKKMITQAPNWDKIRSSIASKYNKYYADKLILDGKARYHGAEKRINQLL